jgi:hypothetical protein
MGRPVGQHSQEGDGWARLGVKPCAVRGYEDNSPHGITSHHDHLVMPPEGFQAEDRPMPVAR